MQINAAKRQRKDDYNQSAVDVRAVSRMLQRENAATSNNSHTYENSLRIFMYKKCTHSILLSDVFHIYNNLILYVSS